MAKGLRENRVPIMMSDSEVEAIDDWRFANRVATRSEAVRQLAETGLSVHKLAGPFIGRAGEKMQDVNSIDRELSDFWARLDREEDFDVSRQMMVEHSISLMTHFDTVRQTAWDLYKEALEVIAATSGITEPSLSDQEIKELLETAEKEFRAGIR